MYVTALVIRLLLKAERHLFIAEIHMRNSNLIKADIVSLNQSGKSSKLEHSAIILIRIYRLRPEKRLSDNVHKFTVHIISQL